MNCKLKCYIPELFILEDSIKELWQMFLKKIKAKYFCTELISLKQENSSLKDQILCKICMEEKVSIAFLPCGHLACCEDCAPAMRKCPVCREFVRHYLDAILVLPS